MSDAKRILLFSGLVTEGTWDCMRRFPDHGEATAEITITEVDGPLRRLVVPRSTNGRGIAAAG